MKDDISARSAAQTSRIHDSAFKHVTGTADYTDDIALPQGTLHAYLGVSNVAHATLHGLDLSAVRAAPPGVVGVLTAADVPAPMISAPPRAATTNPSSPRIRSSSTANRCLR